ncbi:unnamed protein product, partial [Brachionus calyciflorus]
LLLAEGCLSFRKIFIDYSKTESLSGIDPFRECITAASMCHLIYRRNFLKPKTIPFIPERGVYTERNHSYKSNLWLGFISWEQKIYIKSALNDGEEQIGKYYVDGYVPSTKTVYEFHGCYYHGCPKCFSPDTISKKQKLMGSIFKAHKNRIEYIKTKCQKIVL